MPLKSRQVARELGISYWRLVSILRSNKLPEPEKDASGDFVWTRQDVINARRALSVDHRRRKGVPA